MNIDTIINASLLLITAITAMCALKQYVEQKDSQEQAREVCIYLICLFDTEDNLWKPLKIGSQGSNEKTKSMHYGVMIENNSKQPIRDLIVEINEKAFENYKIENMKVAKSVGDTKMGQAPIKLLPPGKWVISIDETPSGVKETKVVSQGMNLLEDLIKFEHAGYVPIVRTDNEGIKRYCFKDHMGHIWRFSSSKGCKLKKIERRKV